MRGHALRRGFKTEAERTAERIRRELKLPPHAPLPARSVIKHLNLLLIEPSDVGALPLAMFDTLLVRDNYSWSAVTIEHPFGDLIIYNPSHNIGRQEADLMHEVSHKLCGHQPEPMVYTTGFPFRTYDEQLEEEAKCLGATLQLPRVALLWAITRGMSNADIGEHFTASLEMVRFRRDTTGVDKQMQYRSRTAIVVG